MASSTVTQPGNSPRRLLHTLCAIGLSVCAASPAAASVTYSLRNYFESLPTPYPAQSASDLWTFQKNGHLGTYLNAEAGRYHIDDVQQIGTLTTIGANGCTSGFCPSVPANSLSTFEGVFVHSGAGSATAAVFHIGSDVTLDAVKLWSEMVGNGNNGNGFAVGVNVIHNGIAQSLGAFTFNYAGTLTTYDEHLFTPGTQLQAGDFVEIAYGNNGSYLYDHGNVEAFITLSPFNREPANSVPEPSALMLMLAGLLAAGSARAWQRQQGHTRR